MAFVDSRLPVDYAVRPTGEITYLTNVMVTPGGKETRTVLRSQHIMRFNVAYSLRDFSVLESIVQLFNAVKGSGSTFRFKWWAEYKSCSVLAMPTPLDQNIGTGTGALAVFQLRKAYTAGASTTYKTIILPVSGTVRIAVAGVEKSNPADFTVNYSTGVVTFSTPPLNGQAVTAGFEFDYQVRFSKDSLAVTPDTVQYGEINLELIEVTDVQT